MTIPRQEALLLAGLLLLAGMTIALVLLLRARRHGISLRMQVFLALGATTLLLTGTFAWIVIDRFEARTVVFAHRAALDDARVVSELTARSMDTLGLSLDQGSWLLEESRVLYGFTSTLEDTRVQLLDRQGRVLFDSLDPTGRAASLLDRPEVRTALSGEADEVARAVGEDQVAAATPIIVGGEVVGVARVVKSTFSMRDVLSDTAPKVALLALILAGAAALVGLFIGRSLGRPIERLTRAAQSIAQGSRQAALPIPRGREVRELTAAFESMRTELEERHAVESLAADLSHELKNPVASIRAAAEVLEDAVVNDTEAAMKFARRISQSAEKLNALIRDLLSLAQLEARGIGESKTEVDVEEIARAALNEVEPRAKERQVQIELICRQKLKLLGDASWLKRAIENLVVNAVECSPPASTVRVRLDDNLGWVEIIVADSGPGIDAAVLDRVFERFVTTRQHEGGTGLGLSIVRAVAEAHSGRVELRSTGEGGTTIALMLSRR